MEDIKEVRTCDCTECTHSAVCKYKKVMEDCKAKLSSAFGISDASPFTVEIQCNYRATLELIKAPYIGHASTSEMTPDVVLTRTAAGNVADIPHVLEANGLKPAPERDDNRGKEIVSKELS